MNKQTFSQCYQHPVRSYLALAAFNITSVRELNMGSYVPMQHASKDLSQKALLFRCLTSTGKWLHSYKESIKKRKPSRKLLKPCTKHVKCISNRTWLPSHLSKQTKLADFNTLSVTITRVSSTTHTFTQ